MRTISLFFKCAMTVLAMQIGHAQQIYSNGPIATGTTSTGNTVAPTGYAWSELQSPNTTYGSSVMYGSIPAIDYSVADDFVVPAGEVWSISSADFYCYQTNYTGVVPPVDQVRVRIWNGDPSLAGSIVLYGDMATNVLNVSNSSDAFVYRITGPADTLRKVWKINASISVSLAAGTYWIEYQVRAADGLNMFSPPVTILDTLSDPNWNAKQREVATWSDLTDAGSGNRRAVAFLLNGNVLGVQSDVFPSMVTLSPNPSSGNIIITDRAQSSDCKIEIYDNLGRTVKSIRSNYADNFTVDVADLNPGGYLLRLVSENGVAVKKFLKL